MKLALVVNRNGKACINWPSVIAAALIASVIATLGAGAFMVAINWYSITAAIVPAVLVGFGLVGVSVRRLLKCSVEQLPRTNS